MSSESTTDLLKQIRHKNSPASMSSSLVKTVVRTPPAPQPNLFTIPEDKIIPKILAASIAPASPVMPTILESSETPISSVINESNNVDIAITSKPLTLDQLLLDLKIIASVKEYDKLAINETTKQLTIDKPYLLQGVLRYLYGQGREHTIEYIEHIINSVFTMTDGLLDDSMTNSIILRFADDTKSIYQNIVHHLTSSINGLQNMKITYMTDIPCTSRIQLIIEKIQNRIQKINNLMKIH
jgi:hypothetical protein